MTETTDPLRAFSGFQIIESVWLTQKGKPYEVGRTWRERLFTRPWRPFQRTRTVTPEVPMKGAIRINANTIAIHPATVRQLREMTNGK